MKLLELLNNLIKIVEDIITFNGIWLCTIMIFIGVINRYFLHFDFMLGIGDLGVYIFIFVALISMAVTTREEGHTSLDMFSSIFKNSPKKQYFYRTIINITSLIFVGIFLSPSYKFLLTALKYPQYGNIIRWFNKSWLMITVFIMGILIFFHLFYRLIHNINVYYKRIL